MDTQTEVGIQKPFVACVSCHGGGRSLSFVVNASVLVRGFSGMLYIAMLSFDFFSVNLVPRQNSTFSSFFQDQSRLPWFVP